jgi:hypothetical protein
MLSMCWILNNCNKLLTTEAIYHTLEVATYPRRVARTGVLQGDAANANVGPARYACTPDNNAT